MSGKAQRVGYRLDSKDVKSLSRDDLITILRAADPLIMSGGRNLLAKILKGSKDKKLLEIGLDACPVYGYFKALNLSDIIARIDWTILHGYLAIEYDYRLPLLVYTELGWEIEMDTYSSELLDLLSEIADTLDAETDMSFLKDRNRKMIFMLLDKIRATGNRKLIPVLERWKQVEYKKVQQRITEVIAEMSHD